MSVPILEIKGLEKSFLSYWLFKKIPVIEDINFSLSAGQAYGFLGHNGAGKTTTLKCICGILKPNSGEILFEGKPLISGKQREAIGFLPEYPYFYDHLSVVESLRFFGQLYGIKSSKLANRIEEVLHDVGLQAKANAKVRTLSKGLQQRLGLGQAILNHPRLLVLDEPLSGLDPNGRADVRKLISRLSKDGTSILMSSHILSDVEEICSRVGIMSKGRFITEVVLDEAAELFDKRYVLTLSSSWEKVREFINSEQVESVDEGNRNNRCSLYVANYAAATKILESCMSSQIPVERFEAIGQKLEDIYLSVTSDAAPGQGESLRVEPQ
jgi:ABC-2 type transport system ATP-binding protein